MDTSLDPWELFVNSVGSKQTKRQYKRRLEDFFLEIGMQEPNAQDMARDFVKKALKDNQWAFSCALHYVSLHRTRCEKGEITPGTLRNCYKPVKSFYEINDIHITWKKLTKGLPKSRKFSLDRSPTTEEIRKLVRYPDRRIKPIILVMSSSGIRVGAWDWLRWGDIETITKGDTEIIAAKMRVYAGEAEEYNTFISAEAYDAVKQWMDFRAEYGEKIGPSSPLMRDLFKTVTMKPGSTRGMAAAPKRMKSESIRNMIRRAWNAEGLIRPERADDDFKSSHGFRKFYKTRCELAGMKPLNVETLMGHDVGIPGAYYRPSEEELLEDYTKALPSLAISEVSEIKQKIAQKKDQELDVENLQNQILQMRAQLISLIGKVLYSKGAADQGGHQGPDDNRDTQPR